MPAPEISLIRALPRRSRYSETYAQEVEDFLTDLEPLPEQINAVAQYLDNRAEELDGAEGSAAESEAAAEGYRDEAENYANAAAATVNFAGRWADLTGSLNTPAVVYHASVYWNLLTNLADVTTSEPTVTNNDWLKVYEITPHHNLTATTDPTANDDETLGYGPTSRWINTATGEFWLCLSAGAAAASWQQATLTVDELGALALGDNAADVPYSNSQSGLSATNAQAAIDELESDAEANRSELLSGLLSNAFVKSDGAQPAWTTPTTTTL
ncbi:hypothetical protein, partial [Marinobacter sp.]|uniref:hypothetical protein n=1 Tax=Marinobacter sp. TaxID=50741 RepID=UPI0034A45447